MTKRKFYGNRIRYEQRAVGHSGQDTPETRYKPGTKICFVEREHEVLFQPLTKEHIRNLAGMLKSSTSATAELLKERKFDKEREDKKFARRRAR